MAIPITQTMAALEERAQTTILPIRIPEMARRLPTETLVMVARAQMHKLQAEKIRRLEKEVLGITLTP